jgi:biopolymer transport protein ExbB/TolQ
METIFTWLGNAVYVALALLALWGAYCVIMVWIRVGRKRFRTEQAQVEFLSAMYEPLSQGDFDTAWELSAGDPRAMCQLSNLAIENRQLGYAKTKQLVADRFQQDVLSDLEYRLDWVNTVIKSAPMVGLLGTVMGMMGAFAKLASATGGVNAAELAKDIQFALITTACGLTIAIPLVLATASINIRMKKMEDLVSGGLNQFFEMFKDAIGSRA